ncbi:MAG: hypothetical protein IPK46_09230 [Saprospiraceae bacterium]|nr:hypothetical protein [Saprospiraceae bacterium]
MYFYPVNPNLMALPKFLTFYQSLDSKQVFQFKKFALTHVGQETDAYRVLDYFSESDDWKLKYPGNEDGERCLPGVNQKPFSITSPCSTI